MTPVKSTNVAAAEYVDGKIRIQFLDGAVYEQPATVQQFGEFMAAPSKGAYVRLYFTALRVAAVLDVKEPAGNSGVTNYVEPDPCCASRLGTALLNGHKGETWVCPKCHGDWSGKVGSGMFASVRVWKPVPAFAVIRSGRAR